MNFAELPHFTKRVDELLDEKSFIGLQVELIRRPEAGDLIVGGGGMRKMRWATSGRGKSGGVRVIYYFQNAKEQIILASIYAKNEKENLSRAELTQLRKEIGI